MPVIQARERKDPERYKPVSLVSKVLRIFYVNVKECWLKTSGEWRR